MQVKKQQLELDMEQQTGSKLRKEYVKAVYCQPAYVTYMQYTSCEMTHWMKHKLESKFPTVDCDPHSQRLWHSQQSRNKCFSGTLLLFL